MQKACPQNTCLEIFASKLNFEVLRNVQTSQCNYNGENIKGSYEAFKSNVHKSREVIDDKVDTFLGGLGHGYKLNMDFGKPSSKA